MYLSCQWTPQKVHLYVFMPTLCFCRIWKTVFLKNVPSWCHSGQGFPSQVKDRSVICFTLEMLRANIPDFVRQNICVSLMLNQRFSVERRKQRTFFFGFVFLHITSCVSQGEKEYISKNRHGEGPWMWKASQNKRVTVTSSISMLDIYIQTGDTFVNEQQR